MFSRPLAPQCPVLAGRRARHIYRGYSSRAGDGIAIPVEVETPRPSLSTVSVASPDLIRSDRTGAIEWTDRTGAKNILRPGEPVVVRYDPVHGRYLRGPTGTERLLPELIAPAEYDKARGDVYCGLLYNDQALHDKLKVKTLLVVVAGHHAALRRRGAAGWNFESSSASGAPATYRLGGSTPVPLGVWLTENTIFLSMPGAVNAA